jgi:hypothetical protein
LSLAAMGNGVPDLLVAIKGITWLVEVKMPKKTQTPDQIKFEKHWQGKQIIVRDVANVQEVVILMEHVVIIHYIILLGIMEVGLILR